VSGIDFVQAEQSSATTRTQFIPSSASSQLECSTITAAIACGVMWWAK